MTLKGSCPVREGGVGVVGIPDAWPSTSRAPMWRKSLYLKGGTTGAMWVKQHLTRSYDRGHLRPKGMRGQEHDAKRLMRLSTNRQEVSQLGRVW